MDILLRKIKRYLSILDEERTKKIKTISNIEYQESGYKKSGELPSPDKFKAFDTERDTWGGSFDAHAWFRCTVTIPEDYENYFIKINTSQVGSWDPDNPQFIAYIDGKMIQGLDINHTRLYFTSSGNHELIFYAYTGIKAITACFGADLMRLYHEVEKLYYDIKVPFDSTEYLDIHGGDYPNILYKLDGALKLLDLSDIPSPSFYASVEAASKYMDEEFYGKFCKIPREDSPTVVGIGHTHIDCAWQWTLKQTREKVQRSFSVVRELVKKYPEYRFMSSQALLYKMLKEEDPSLYEEVKEMIRLGKWECEGAMWVEADCNLTSGESLVRQVMYGKRFFKDEFGVENRVLWLPDVFGYSAAMPQILKKSGIDWFVTSKISWNDTNTMPHDTFLWRGIDGTEINTYFLTAQSKKRGEEPEKYTTYVAHTTPQMIAGTYERYKNKEINNETIITFGYGDGGGGTTEEHMEMAKRLSHGIPGTPIFKIDFAGNVLKRIEKKIKNHPRLPVWSGELYLEFHRGTYTTQANNKKNNRRSEELYLKTELFSTINKELLGAKFPKAELHEGWEMILTNQFHDIIPGSSIREVYEQCDKDYKTISDIATKNLNASIQSIASSLPHGSKAVVFNSNPTTEYATLKLDGKTVIAKNLMPSGYTADAEFIVDSKVKITESSIESKLFKIKLNKDKNITSIYDKKNNREIIKKGGLGGALRIYQDYPDSYDAWEWSEYAIESFDVITDVTSCEPIYDGARGGLKITRKLGSSTFSEKIWLYDELDRIDFELDADWQETHKCLKCAFDVDINTQRATYEIQYGTVERPTHKNTSWDKAKYEVCGHRFADVSDGGYGTALLNDSKYGYDIHDGVMTLTLLRSPTWPDEIADKGNHSIKYSLYPHINAADSVKLYSHAYALNNPPTAILCDKPSGSLPRSFSIAMPDKKNVLLEVAKEAEEGCATVYRLYECANARTKTRITFGKTPRRVFLADMQENPIRELKLTGNTILLEFSGFEIHTLIAE